jgi:hypothetical protein
MHYFRLSPEQRRKQAEREQRIRWAEQGIAVTPKPEKEVFLSKMWEMMSGLRGRADDL